MSTTANLVCTDVRRQGGARCKLTYGRICVGKEGLGASSLGQVEEVAASEGVPELVREYLPRAERAPRYPADPLRVGARGLHMCGGGGGVVTFAVSR